jgi:hypothetical protein
MLLHLQLEESLQGLFHQTLHDGFRIHRRCPATGTNPIDEEFLKGLRILRQAGDVDYCCVFVHRAIPLTFPSVSLRRVSGVGLAGVRRRFPG